MDTQYFYIAGMTCSGCERRIWQAVSQLEGVHSARVAYPKGQLEVQFSAPCTPEQISDAVQKAGYTVADTPPQKTDALYLLVILFGLSVIARQLGWTEFFQAFPTVSGQQLGYLTLFLTGVFTSAHCVAMCGGLNLAQSMTAGNIRPIRGSLLYNLGRLTSYTLVGGILGFIGEKAAITLRLRGLIGLGAGIVMLLMGVRMLTGYSLPRIFRFRLPRPLKRLVAFQRYGPFVIGLVNSFMPCGPLQSMQLYAIASGNFLTGAASMFFFCLGTIPLVLLFGAAAGFLRMNWRQTILRIGAALLVLIGLSTVQNNLALTGILLPWHQTGGGNDMLTAVTEGGKQYITTQLHANGYDDIRVTAGIPVVWTITADEASLNGCNNELVIPEFNQHVRLEPGTTTITFVPSVPGVYSYTCWMGMLKNTITVTSAEELPTNDQ